MYVLEKNLPVKKPCRKQRSINLQRLERRVLTRGSRQMDTLTRPFGSLPAGINRTTSAYDFTAKIIPAYWDRSGWTRYIRPLSPESLKDAPASYQICGFFQHRFRTGQRGEKDDIRYTAVLHRVNAPRYTFSHTAEMPRGIFSPPPAFRFSYRYWV